MAGASPRAVLARLVQGDPLGVRHRVAAHLRERALLLDADRVHLRALARCARYASRARGRPRLPVWLAQQVEEAARDVLREEARALAGGDGVRGEGGDDPRGAPPAGAHADLARPLGLDPRALRAACDAFHRRPQPEREAFFRLVLERAPLDDVAREAGASASEVARRARRALDAVLAGAAGSAPGAAGAPGAAREEPR